jgi:hypothetical protein
MHPPFFTTFSTVRYPRKRKRMVVILSIKCTNMKTMISGTNGKDFFISWIIIRITGIRWARMFLSPCNKIYSSLVPWLQYTSLVTSQDCGENSYFTCLSRTTYQQQTPSRLHSDSDKSLSRGLLVEINFKLPF